MSLEHQPPHEPLRSGLFGRSKPQSNDPLIRFIGAISRSEWQVAEQLLAQIESHNYQADPVFRETLENSHHGANGYSPIHTMVAESQIGLLRDLHKLGINIFGLTQPSRGLQLSSLHLAVDLGAVESVKLLVELGADIEELSAHGLTPLMVALEHSMRGYSNDASRRYFKDNVIAILLDAGADLTKVSDNLLPGAYLHGQRINADLTRRDLRAANFVDADLSQAKLDQANLQDAIYSSATKFPADFDPQQHGMVAAALVHDGENEFEMGLDELIAYNQQAAPWAYLYDKRSDEYSTRLADRLSNEENRLRHLGASERDIFHYRAAFDCSAFPKADLGGDGQPFLRLFPALTTNFPPGSVDQLLAAFELTLDDFDPPRGGHSNMAEFFALLNHPGLSELTPETVGALTSLITAADHWLLRDEETNITVEHVRAWRDLGYLSFAHLGLKYDAKRINHDGLRLPCLLEQFGFERIATRETDFDYQIGQQPFKGYGSGYKLILNDQNRPFLERLNFPLDLDFYLEARRGYFLFSQQSLGTLLVRNSSPHFGRDLLPVPALFSYEKVIRQLTVDQLEAIDDVEIFRMFQSVLSIDLNLSHNRFEHTLLALTSNLRAALAAYEAWKFETEFSRAFKLVDGDIVGGYNSSGFKAVVDDLEMRFWIAQENPNEAMPALAFAAHNQPAWNFCPWQDRAGIEQRKFEITQFRLDVLRKLANGGRFAVSDSDLAQSEVRSFIEAGFHYQGRLVLVDSEGEVPK